MFDPMISHFLVPTRSQLTNQLLVFIVYDLCVCFAHCVLAHLAYLVALFFGIVFGAIYSPHPVLQHSSG